MHPKTTTHNAHTPTHTDTDTHIPLKQQPFEVLVQLILVLIHESLHRVGDVAGVVHDAEVEIVAERLLFGTFLFVCDVCVRFKIKLANSGRECISAADSALKERRIFH